MTTSDGAGDGGFQLGIDFGTSHTAAVLRWPDGRINALLFDGSPVLLSAVYADATAGLLVGRDAWQAARVAPERFEPYPKRHVDHGVVLLGDTEVSVAELFAAVLGRVAKEARRVAGGEPDAVVVTHPAAWGTPRRDVLRAAARAAGLSTVELVAEPVAAAAYFLDVAEARVPAGSCAVVYDFGAGTFDATVVRRTDDGFAVLATRGVDDAGGLDIDAAIMADLTAVYGERHPDAWRRLTRPTTAADRRAARQLWDDVRGAKEALSRTSSTLIHLPLVDGDAPLGRGRLEELARPVLDRTIATTRAVLDEARVDPGDLAGVFLVGGSSRLPLAATLLHRALGVAPTVIEQPEIAVAEGSLRTGSPVLSNPEPSSPEPSSRPPDAFPPTDVVTAPDLPSARGNQRRLALVGGVLALVVAATTIAALLDTDDDPGAPRPTASASGSGAASNEVRVVPGVIDTGDQSTHEVAFHPAGKLIATGGEDEDALGHSVRLWDVATHKRVGDSFNGERMAFSPDGTVLAVTSEASDVKADEDQDTDAVHLWDVAQRRKLGELTTGLEFVNGIVFSPDGATLALYGGNDHVIQLWDVETRKQDDDSPITAYRDANITVDSVAFSPDSEILVTCGGKGPILLWDAGTQELLDPPLPLPGNGIATHDIAFSRAGVIAATTDDGRTLLWDAASRKPLGALAGHFGAVFGVAFSSDGKLVATSGHDGTVRLWNVATQEQLGDPMTGHVGSVYTVTFSPDGKSLASVGKDGTARLWDITDRIP